MNKTVLSAAQIEAIYLVDLKRAKETYDALIEAAVRRLSFWLLNMANFGEFGRGVIGSTTGFDPVSRGSNPCA